MSSKDPCEPSAAIRQRVITVLALQKRRFRDEPVIYCNAQMTLSLLHKYAEPNAVGLEKLKDAMDRMNMSARATASTPSRSPTSATSSQPPATLSPAARAAGSTPGPNPAKNSLPAPPPNNPSNPNFGTSCQCTPSHWLGKPHL